MRFNRARYALGAWAILKPSERRSRRPGLPMRFNAGQALCGASGALGAGKEKPAGWGGLGGGGAELSGDALYPQP